MTITLDISREASARRSAEIDARLAKVGATGDARIEARKRITAEVEAEELSAATAAANRVEAEAERARIASIVRLGRNMSRERQALRLALLGPVTPAQASAMLGAMGRDAEADEAAMAVPSFTPFGTSAAEGERRRISAIYANPAAAGRFRSACAMALEGDAPADAVGNLLAGLPVEKPEAAIPLIGSAEDDSPSFGADPVGGMTKGQKTADAWSRAVRDANASIGIAPPAAAAPAAIPQVSE